MTRVWWVYHMGGIVIILFKIICRKSYAWWRYSRGVMVGWWWWGGRIVVVVVVVWWVAWWEVGGGRVDGHWGI